MSEKEIKHWSDGVQYYGSCAAKEEPTMPSDCINKHTKSPTGYIAWHDWAEKKSKRHYQVRCPKCGLFAIWKRKTQR